MIEAGNFYSLKINRQSTPGMYLGNGEEEVLLPNRYIKEEFEIGQQLEVFIYTDSEDRLVATTERPYAQVNEITVLQLKDLVPFGAFFDWGLSKDLLVPKSEMLPRMRQDEYYPIIVLNDPQSNRVVGSAKIQDFVSNSDDQIQVNEIYSGIVYDQSELGFKVCFLNKYSGLLYQNEVFQALQIGDHVEVKIHQIREDGKIDLKLSIDKSELKDKILKRLKESNGFLTIHDKSEPNLIYASFGASKKAFKAAIGGLYKDKLIEIFRDGIKLVDQG